MDTVPKNFFRPLGFFAHIIGIPVFVLGSFLLFWPAGFRDLDITFSEYSFHMTMIACIILVVMLIAKIVMMVLCGKNDTTWTQYYLCTFSEIIFSTGFSALYLWLMSHKAQAYFWFFGYSLLYLTILITIPYIIINLYFIGVEKDELLQHAANANPSEKIKFMDERGNVKILIAPEVVLYIQSDENYLKICYLEDDKMTFYTLRNSMKKIEELCSRNGLVRCHRSYFVNKGHVKVLQKDKDFTYAVLDVPSAAHIPVSKNYIDQVSAIL